MHPIAMFRILVVVVAVVVAALLSSSLVHSSSTSSEEEEEEEVSTLLWEDVCTQNDVKDLPFCDPHHHNLDARVADYVSRVVPTEQRIRMMLNTAAGYPKLHIPPYQWGTEGLHGAWQECVPVDHDDLAGSSNNETIGASRCKCPTSFPAPTGLGAALNPELWHAVGRVVGIEGRAISNLRAQHTNVWGDGLTYWSPTVNLQRDPRWGRNQEVPGEDPAVTSAYAEAYIRGLQSANEYNPYNSNGPLVGAACKHFVANSLEQWHDATRHNFNAVVSKADLYNYYFPPFEACVRRKSSNDDNSSADAGATAVGIMCSYNSLNGVPACANDWLLKSVLREEWNFTGYIVTDCNALRDTISGHGYAADATEAAALALHATVDVNCGNGTYYPAGLLQAYQRGKVTAKRVEESFTRLARVQFRLGLFDPKKKKGKANCEADLRRVDAPGHRQLAYRAALESMVLLKNDDNALPLDSERNLSLAVIGPHIHATQVLLSDYHGDRCCRHGNFDCMETPLQAIAKANAGGGATTGVRGCTVSGTDLNEIDNAVRVANASDAVLLFVGLDQEQETEGIDRYETTLPGLQTQLISAILDLIPNKTTILVLINGGALSLGQDTIDGASAILETYYGGQAASKATADILFGEYNPTGKLVATAYPPSYVGEIPLTEMGLNVGPGRTHMYYKGKPEFPFGHGLSYSKWKLDWAVSSSSSSLPSPGAYPERGVHVLNGDEQGGAAELELAVEVSNEGPLPGRQTVLLLWRPLDVPQIDIVQKLIHFQGTAHLLPGQKETLAFAVRPRDLALWTEQPLPPDIVAQGGGGGNNRVVAAGTYQLEARAANNVRIATLLRVPSPIIIATTTGSTTTTAGTEEQ